MRTETRSRPAAAASLTASPSARRNQLLDALPAEVYARLLPHLELVALRTGQSLYECGDFQGQAFFPTSAIASMAYDMADGSSASFALVGSEGVLGLALLTGGKSLPSRATIASGGLAYRLGGGAMKEELASAGALLHLLLRYLQALIAQITHIAACNRHHTVDQQLCRLLLMALDRSPSSDLGMSQELIADLLGVRREGITEAAGRLRAAGLISYRRGHITVLERSMLEARACGCYAAITRAHDWPRRPPLQLVQSPPRTGPAGRQQIDRPERVVGLAMPA